MADTHQCQVLVEPAGEVPRTIVRSSEVLSSMGTSPSREVYGLLHHLDEAGSRHTRLQLPGQDEAAVVVHDGHQVVPSPVHHLQMGTVGGPQLMGSGGLTLVFFLGFEPTIRAALTNPSRLRRR